MFPLISILGPIVANLAKGGLSLLGDAVLSKGKDFLEKETGVDLSKPVLTDEDMLTLKKYEMDHEESLLALTLADDKLELKRQALYVADVDSARVMQTSALEQDDAFSKRFVYYFAIFWSFIAASYVFCITFLSIPPSSLRFADTVLGFLLGTIVAQIVNFFYGSSASSHQKTQHLMKQTGVK